MPRHIFEKHPSIKFDENLSSRGPSYLIRSERWTDGKTDGQTDMTELIVDFHNFANSSKNRIHFSL